MFVALLVFVVVLPPNNTRYIMHIHTATARYMLSGSVVYVCAKGRLPSFYVCLLIKLYMYVAFVYEVGVVASCKVPWMPECKCRTSAAWPHQPAPSHFGFIVVCLLVARLQHAFFASKLKHLGGRAQDTAVCWKRIQAQCAGISSIAGRWVCGGIRRWCMKEFE